MSSKKNRDIAQELVDFLLTEDEKKKSSAPEKPAAKQPKPAATSSAKPAMSGTPAPKNADATQVLPKKADGSMISPIKETTVDAKTFFFSTQAKTVALPKNEAGEEPTVVSSSGKTPAADEIEVIQNTPPPIPSVRFGVTQGKSIQLSPHFESSNEKVQALLDEATSISEPIFELEETAGKTQVKKTEVKKSETKLPEARPSDAKAGVPKPAATSQSAGFEFSLKTTPKADSAESESKSITKPNSVSKPDVKSDSKIPVPMAQDQSSQRAKVIFSEVSTLMAGAEAVKVAQARITALEKERDQLRDETEQLLQASETLQRRYNELKGEHDRLERKHREKVEILEDEKQVLRTRLKAREEELEKIKNENEELKLRFQSDLRKIRVRERELEHRQEIMKAEQTTLLQAKDEVILELKRQLERLHFELDNFRAKSADMNTKLNEYFERNHRTVKALRLALSVLESGDSDDKNKKVG